MTAALLDLLELEGRLVPEGQRREDLVRLVQQVVASLVQGARQLREYERQIYLTPAPNEQVELQRDEAIHRLFGEWLAEAQDLLTRVMAVRSLELNAAATEALRDEMAFAGARLKLTPQKLANARRQIRDGQGIPIEVIRNELQARRRA